jgi:hypothetical protein
VALAFMAPGSIPRDRATKRKVIERVKVVSQGMQVYTAVRHPGEGLIGLASCGSLWDPVVGLSNLTT